MATTTTMKNRFTLVAFCAALLIATSQAFVVPSINNKNTFVSSFYVPPAEAAACTAAQSSSSTTTSTTCLWASVTERPGTQTSSGDDDSSSEVDMEQFRAQVSNIKELKESKATLEAQLDETKSKIEAFEADLEEAQKDIIGLKNEIIENTESFNKRMYHKEEHVNKLNLLIVYYKDRYNASAKTNKETIQALQDRITELENERESFRAMAKQACRVAGTKLQFWK